MWVMIIKQFNSMLRIISLLYSRDFCTRERQEVSRIGNTLLEGGRIISRELEYMYIVECLGLLETEQRMNQ